MAKLYEILTEIEELSYQLFDEETGEVNEEIEKQMLDLDVERKSKIENIACLIKNLNSDADQIAAESKRLKERADRLTRKAERLTDWIAYVLDGEKMNTSKVSIGWKKGKRVDILDETLIPAEYIKCRVESKPDKVKLKKALDAGEVIDGAIITVTNNIQIK